MKYFNNGSSVSEMKKQGRLRVGERIRCLRKRNNEKQRELAELLKVSRSQIARVESGKADAKASDIAILADKYDTYAETFFNEDGKMPADLIQRIIKTLKIKDERDRAYNCMNYMLNTVLDSDRAGDFAKMFLISLYSSYDTTSEHSFVDSLREELADPTLRMFLDNVDEWND